MKLSKIAATSIAVVSASFAMSATAAAPQTGMWFIQGGQDAYGGNIINIDLQDDKVSIIFAAGAVPLDTYFMYGVGTFVGDAVHIDLISSRDTSTTIPVTATFDTSTHGTFNFPGVGTRTVSRAKLNDETKPQSMFGSWGFAIYDLSAPPGTLGASFAFIFNHVLPPTPSGGGVAVDTTGQFGCEYQVSGALTGQTLCVFAPSNEKFYLKRSVNYADGTFASPSSTVTFGATANRWSNAHGDFLFLREQGEPDPNLPRLIEEAAAAYDAGLADGGN